MRDLLEQVRSRMSAGGHVAVFPEGTSSRGETVLPFRTAAFAAVAGAPGSAILPVRIDPLEADGSPADGRVRDIACWHGDTEFAPRFWRFLRAGGARFRVGIGDALRCDALDRKTAAPIAHDSVAALEKDDMRAGPFTIR